MSGESSNPYPTLELETKVEEDFVAPLTAIRGSLEILRDVAELSDDERHKFLETALRGCSRLEQSVRELGEAVYSAAGAAQADSDDDFETEHHKQYASRIHVLSDIDTIEIDYSDFVFSSSKIVDDFHEAVEELVEKSGRKWYFLVNYRNCSIWPEAWVAFAHRGKKVNVSYSLGTVRYIEPEDGEPDPTTDSFDPDLFTSRALALARLDEIKSIARHCR